MRRFSCGHCGSTRFWRRVTYEQIVDWSREGEFEGRPYRGGGKWPLFPVEFVCIECSRQVIRDVADEMEEAV